MITPFKIFLTLFLIAIVITVIFKSKDGKNDEHWGAAAYLLWAAWFLSGIVCIWSYHLP